MRGSVGKNYYEATSRVRGFLLNWPNKILGKGEQERSGCGMRGLIRYLKWGKFSLN